MYCLQFNIFLKLFLKSLPTTFFLYIYKKEKKVEKAGEVWVYMLNTHYIYGFLIIFSAEEFLKHRNISFNWIFFFFWFWAFWLPIIY